MKSKAPVLLGLMVLIFAGCEKETRNGELQLSGSTPVRIVDEGGKTVEFFSGPTKVEFSAGSSRKFTVTVSQGDKKAKFSGKAPSSNDTWNFTLRGSEIGQPIDLTSARSIVLIGKPWRQMGRGGMCGRGGTWVTDDEYQKGNEDWSVSFADAANSQSLGAFRSRRENEQYLISSRNIYCEGERDHEPRPPFPRHDRNLSKAQDAVKKLSVLAESGIRFD